MLRSSLVFLVTVALLCSMCISVFALADIDDSPYRQSIETMVELQVLEGRGDGRFWPDAELTRAEAAKVAAYLAGFTAEDAVEAASWPPVFDDVFPGMETTIPATTCRWCSGPRS